MNAFRSALRHLLLAALCTGASLPAIAQSEGISPTYSFSIRKKVEPPLLSFVPGSVRFEDADGNNAINADEACALVFEVRNTGTGDGLNLKGKVTAAGTTTALNLPAPQPLETVAKGTTRSCRIPFRSGRGTADGRVSLTLEVEEPNGFNTDPVTLELETRRFLAPSVRVVDHTVFSTDGSPTLALKRPFKLQLLVQNTGQGTATDVRYSLAIPANVFLSDGEQTATLGTLAPGETRSVELEMIMNAKFEGRTLALSMDLTEAMKQYATPWTASFTLDQALAAERLVVSSRPQETSDVTVASLRSDVDKDIPAGLPQDARKYALIIGNEDYSRYQPGLEREVNVDHAANDARVFAEYAERTLGVPKGNITLLIDATKGQMTQALAKHERLLEVEKGQAEIILYYSGHGLPEEGTNTPYLIPVDVNGMQPANGIALHEVYTRLTRHPVRKAIVVLDACFSGGARGQELVAMKGVRVNAGVSTVPGPLVVLASSSGTEASAVWRDRQHGYFTYFLLKELQGGAWQAPLRPTMERVQQNVARETARIGKVQTPTLLGGPQAMGQLDQLGW
jgi:hypothetical protein